MADGARFLQTLPAASVDAVIGNYLVGLRRSGEAATSTPRADASTE